MTKQTSTKSRKQQRPDRFTIEQIAAMVSLAALSLSIIFIPVLGFDYLLLIGGLSIIGLVYSLTYRQVKEFVEQYRELKIDDTEPSPNDDSVSLLGHADGSPDVKQPTPQVDEANETKSHAIDGQEVIPPERDAPERNAASPS